MADDLFSFQNPLIREMVGGVLKQFIARGSSDGTGLSTHPIIEDLGTQDEYNLNESTSSIESYQSNVDDQAIISDNKTLIAKSDSSVTKSDSLVVKTDDDDSDMAYWSGLIFGAATMMIIMGKNKGTTKVAKMNGARATTTVAVVAIMVFGIIILVLLFYMFYRREVDDEKDNLLKGNSSNEIKVHIAGPQNDSITGLSECLRSLTDSSNLKQRLFTQLNNLVSESSNHVNYNPQITNLRKRRRNNITFSSSSYPEDRPNNIDNLFNYDLNNDPIVYSDNNVYQISSYRQPIGIGNQHRYTGRYNYTQASPFSPEIFSHTGYPLYHQVPQHFDLYGHPIEPNNLSNYISSGLIHLSHNGNYIENARSYLDNPQITNELPDKNPVGKSNNMIWNPYSKEQTKDHKSYILKNNIMKNNSYHMNIPRNIFIQSALNSMNESPFHMFSNDIHSKPYNSGNIMFIATSNEVESDKVDKPESIPIPKIYRPYPSGTIIQVHNGQ